MRAMADGINTGTCQVGSAKSDANFFLHPNCDSGYVNYTQSIVWCDGDSSFTVSLPATTLVTLGT